MLWPLLVHGSNGSADRSLLLGKDRGPGRAGRGDSGGGGPGRRPGSLSSVERLLLLGAILIIATWGFTGLDRYGEPADDSLAVVVSDGEGKAAALPNGADLFQAMGCGACHSVDGGTIVGPSLRGIFGSQQALAGGTSVVVDRDYVRESILYPQSKIAAGFPESMPSYEGLMSEAELDALVDYIESLR